MYIFAITVWGECQTEEEVKEKIRAMMAEIYDAYQGDDIGLNLAGAWRDSNVDHYQESLIMNEDGILQNWSDGDGQETSEADGVK